jgi:hypothetical protein
MCLREAKISRKKRKFPKKNLITPEHPPPQSANFGAAPPQKFAAHLVNPKKIT